LASFQSRTTLFDEIRAPPLFRRQSSAKEPEFDNAGLAGIEFAERRQGIVKRHYFTRL